MNEISAVKSSVKMINIETCADCIYGFSQDAYEKIVDWSEADCNSQCFYEICNELKRLHVRITVCTDYVSFKLFHPSQRQVAAPNSQARISVCEFFCYSVPVG